MRSLTRTLLTLLTVFALVLTGCTNAQGTTPVKETTESANPKTDDATTAEPISPPTDATTTTAQPEETTTAEEAGSEYRNLCATFLDDTGVTERNKWTMYDWDKEGQYMTASHSLEVAWANGYGKAWLFDGVKSSDETMFDVGAYLSCTINPGWGEFSGSIDESTVTWKKKDLNEWIEINLQGIFTIDKVNFSTLYTLGEHGMPSDFTIAVSADHEHFTTVVDEVGYHQDITSKDQSFSFEPIEAQYVYFHFTKGTKSIDNNLAYCVGLSEIEIWGK